MIAVLEQSCTLDKKASVVRFLEGQGFRVQVSESGSGSFVNVIGTGSEALAEALQTMPGVVSVKVDGVLYPLVSLEYHPERTRVKASGITIGGAEIVVMAGPCSVESREQLGAVARTVAESGAVVLRGGAFKPRSSPYSFHRLGEAGLERLAEARRQTGLRVVTEVVAPEDVELVGRYADILQIGARNIQNFRLLSTLGAQPKPVLLKRGMVSTIEELLMAAEYIVAGGNPRVILCERGIRTFDTSMRYTLDLGAVPVLKEKSHLPVIVDPSHAAGRRELVPALARAAIAVGADGLIVEVHHDPDRALSDGRQSLTLDGFREMMNDLKKVSAALERPLASAMSVGFTASS